ncbi:hypothetical protein HYH03_009061 [Edaphochlamys debaryana]|uniref:CAAX prenyl protease 2/Lysostaphin resistance protein A-like domain-containing protein n=1 Tax=Edaphochlamys debaryana TaxID=47281 RepID=A0A835XZ45_9CHLO|nr:hypothetical protein HYH03_009061 [Edaphochlamys debaryana]|eukprot:KAG2492645.1 hypothetical protein HYH03_009061 [Edaphochlamys debaryana]
MLRLFWRRLAASALTFPTLRGWGYVAAALGASAAVSLPLGLATGFFNPRQRVRDTSLVLRVSAGAFVVPALLEEAVFRAALLPHPAVDPAGALGPAAFARAAVGPLALFVVAHLANPRPQSRAVFQDWRFLALAGALGAACSAAYWATGGSLAAAAVAHHVPIVVWMFGLGGWQRLGFDRQGGR